MGGRLRWWIALPLAAVLAGCNNQDSGTRAAPPEPLTARSAVPETPSPPSYDLTLGKSVFTDKCLRCHGEGDYNAPRLGNANDWQARVRQDLATLIEHALNGHGRMPPRGGFTELSDREISAAVAYVVDRSKKIILAFERQRRQRDCAPDRADEDCPGVDARDLMTLQMLWLLGSPREQ